VCFPSPARVSTKLATDQIGRWQAWSVVWPNYTPCLSDCLPSAHVHRDFTVLLYIASWSPRTQPSLGLPHVPPLEACLRVYFLRSHHPAPERLGPSGSLTSPLVPCYSVPLLASNAATDVYAVSEALLAPVGGHRIRCDLSDMDSCSLHLRSVTIPHNFACIHSSPAPGFVMGVSSIGATLCPYEESDMIFLSTDAGVT
jgi:hypothetical protein